MSIYLFISINQFLSDSERWVLTVGWSQTVMLPHMESVLSPDGFGEGDFSLEIVPTPGTVLVGNKLLDLLVSCPHHRLPLPPVRCLRRKNPQHYSLREQFWEPTRGLKYHKIAIGMIRKWPFLLDNLV